MQSSGIRRFLAGTLAFCTLACFNVASADPVKILPLGDSLTSGANHSASFRYELYFMLKDAGYDVDFVGNNHTTYDGPNLDWYPRYESEFDPDHQGMYGARSDEMVGVGRAVASQHQPDIVLLQAGSNDIFFQGAGGVINAKFGITDIIEGIRAVAPGVTFIVSLCTPVRASGFFGDQAPHVEPLNDMIAELGPTLDRPDSPVIVVDVVTGFNVDTMLQRDGGHHSLLGEAFVAERNFDILKEILPEPGTDMFSINRGHAGAWFEPTTAGQGLLIDVDPENQFLFLAWFAYTPEGGLDAGQQHWFTAQGNYEADTAELAVYRTLGGRFDDPQPVSTDPVGNVTLNLTDCSGGSLDYRIDPWSAEGSIQLERVIPGTENVCGNLEGEPGATLGGNDGWDGAWFDENSPGQGILIDVQTQSQGDDFLFLAWFAFGDQTDSGLRWLTAQGPLSGHLADIAIYETTGGSFNASTPVVTEAIGSMKLEFLDCNHLRIDYLFDGTGQESSIEMTRVIPGTESLCSSLQ